MRFFFFALLFALCSGPILGVDTTGIDLTVLATNLDAPVALTHSGDTRLFITLQGGKVMIFNTNTQRVIPTPFLDISDRVVRGGERGLLSIAFHPSYLNNRFFFVNYTNVVGSTVIARYSRSSADRNLADVNSETILLEIPQPFANHNGGQLQFGPDGLLYVAMGDGGSANDPNCSAQDGSSLLGKILRLDVDQNALTAPFHGIPTSNPFVGDNAVRDEIWAFGLRNPWRFSFDRQTGEVYIADVGQNQFEEVNVQAAGSGGGENYGWKMMEGFSCTNNTNGCGFSIPGCDAPDYTSPIFDYNHQSGRCSITGGYVYRGAAIPQVQGAYFYGDFCSGEIWAAERAGNGWRSDAITPRAANLTSFGEGRDGELYVLGSGTLYQLTGPSGGGGGETCTLEVGDPRYCEECGPCAEGQGGCRGDDTCDAGLTCAENFGARFDLARSADVCLTARSLDPPPYILTEYAVTGDVNRLHGVSINNAGLVTGWAESAGGGAGSSRAVRFEADGSSLFLDPQSRPTRGLAINDRGDVYGVFLGGNRQTGVFQYRTDGGFDLINEGINNLIRTTFDLAAMNSFGELAGSVTRGNGELRPYLYSVAQGGWTDLTQLSPRFSDLSTRTQLINDNGDLVFQSFRSDPNTVVVSETAILHGDQLFELGNLGGRVNIPRAVNPSGRVVGSASTDDGSRRAYVYSGPGGRLIDIHPRKFASSNAIAVTAKGIVGGTIANTSPSGDRTDTIFTWDNRRQIKTRLQARAPDFERLLADDTLSLQGLDSVHMNQRLEFAGRILVSPANPDTVSQRFFYYSPATGLVDVQSLLEASGSGAVVIDITDLNDWGSLLLRVEEGGDERVVVLTPDES